jgi:WD40 repeat protein
VSLLEILDQVRTREPVPPRQLQPGVARDVETICLKCLQKQPSRRYASAAALADDLKRFLNGEPIVARPTRTSEKAWKWARRRPALAASLAAITVLLLAGITATTILWRSAVSARRASDTHLAGRVTTLARYAWMTDDLDLARQALSECPPTLRDSEWHYVNRACNAEQFHLGGKQSAVALAFRGHGQQQLVSYCADANVYLWDVGEQTVRWSWPWNTGGCREIGFNADGSEVVLAANTVMQSTNQSSAFIVGLNAATGQESWRCRLAGQFDSLALSADKRSAVLWDIRARHIKVIALPAGDVTATFALAPGALPFSQSFSPDGSRIATLLRTGGLLIWNAKTGKQEQFVPLRTIDNCSVAFSPDGKRVATAINDLVKSSQVVVFDAESGAERLRLAAPSNRTNHVQFTPDGRRLVSASTTDRRIVIWDAQTGQEQLTLRGSSSGTRSLAITSDGRFLATGGFDPAVRFWDPRTADRSSE